MAERVESLESDEMEDYDAAEPPAKVSFSEAGRNVAPATPSLKLHLLEEEVISEEKGSGNMWQIYALGGFMVLSWMWARWRERKGKGRPSEP